MNQRGGIEISGKLVRRIHVTEKGIGKGIGITEKESLGIMMANTGYPRQVRNETVNTVLQV